jgi:hypothetical protein
VACICSLPCGEDYLVLNLIGQVFALLFMVGGIVVSALALSDRARRISIGAFSILGVANLMLIIVTYEHTPDVPHFSDLVVVLAMAAAKAHNNLIDLAENRAFELIAAVAVGIGLGFFGPREYRKRKQRRWLSSYDIFKLANPDLMKDAEIAEEEVQKLSERMRELQIERESLGQPFGSGPISEEPEYMAKLREAARDASARNLALHELREKARSNALGDIYEKLKNEKLVAKGFKDPLGLHPTENEIPATYWKFLKFSGDYKEAEGKGIKYTAIEIARK